MVGVTLLELLVTLVVLGVLVSVSGVAVATLASPGTPPAVRDLQTARATAIRTGKPVSLHLDSLTVRFFPDGRAVGTGVDPLTGDVDAAH